MYKIVYINTGHNYVFNGQITILTTNNLMLRGLLYELLQKRLYQNPICKMVEESPA